ncbi:pyridoxal phosphate-dependent aminotransferase [Oceanibacterium hippocampi]|uniref:Aminotransferase n=1 Tax=Oceanibacterium hippocampi TaxID=745714 RepID=A0A1Y5TWL8_9PROT|nr:pyridoxal phosphate-dependent aminotransferase [Oceanibacterium hippocampi]SLN75470.1 Aspartate aminotransferase [Oceanibacterium hippocampi]
MRQFEEKNAYFDQLFSTPGLKWLGQNTNHMPMHPSVRQALLQAVEDEGFHAYAPPAGFEALRQGIVADLDLPGASALVTDGAVGGLFLVCHAFCRPGTNFVTTDPGWKWPMQFARQAGAEVREIAIYDPALNYRLSPEQLRATVDQDTAIIYIVDPNNPLGICYTRDEISAFCEIARGVDAILLHDCTYRDFAFDHTLAATFYPEGTVTSYSFSKWLGLAGLRIGAVISNPDVVETLAGISPSTLGSSVIAQRGALAGLAVKGAWMEEVLRVQRGNQDRIREVVDSVPGLSLPVFPSNGNFLVVECAELGIAPEALVAAYQERGIMIRQGRYHTPRFGDRFIKVSTSVPASWVEEFCGLLPEMIETARGMNMTRPLF